MYIVQIEVQILFCCVFRQRIVTRKSWGRLGVESTNFGPI